MEFKTLRDAARYMAENKVDHLALEFDHSRLAYVTPADDKDCDGNCAKCTLGGPAVHVGNKLRDVAELRGFSPEELEKAQSKFIKEVSSAFAIPKGMVKHDPVVDQVITHSHAVNKSDARIPDAMLRSLGDDIGFGLNQLRILEKFVAGQEPRGESALAPTPENFRVALLALITELGELTNEMKIKAWRKDHKGPKGVSLAQRKKILEEFGDVLAFLGLLLILMHNAGYSPKNLADAFVAACNKNIDRFQGLKVGGR